MKSGDGKNWISVVVVAQYREIKMNNDLMFSSKNSKWETDPELLAKLAPHFPWDLDVCAERGNDRENYEEV
jgi:hypothetical protein